MYNDIINQKVKDNFQLIRDNYFMLGISNTNNNKLKDLSGKYGPRYNYGNVPPPIFVESLIDALNSNDLSKAKSIWIRYFNNLVNNNNGGMNPNLLTFQGKSVAELFNVNIDKKYHLYPDVINIQNKLIEAQLLGKDVKPKQVMYYYTKNLAVSKNKALAFSKSVVEDSGVVKMSKDSNSENTINQASVIDKALRIARDPKAPIKKIRVFDFDDTLARTKSNVLYTMPDGTTGKLTAEEFAKRS